MEVREGGDVEVASDEDGFRGAWFSAKVVKKEKGHVVVEYRELRSDKDESKALREKVALRHLRPPPPSFSPPPLHYALYQEVDAYDNDGWWVGVVTKLLADNYYLVYFMQTNEEIQFHHSQLRPHFDFLDNKWFQPSEALAGSHSLEEDEDLENDNGTIMPYILCQPTGTRELPFQKVDDNISEPVRRSLRNTMIKRTGETKGHLANISPSSMKKARKDVVDLETTELSFQKNGNQECHQISASPSFDKGVDTRSLHYHHEAINHQKSFEGEKTKRSGLRKSQRKNDSYLNNVSTGEWKDEDTHGTGATDVEIPGNVIAEKGRQKSCLKTSPSKVINATGLKAHNEVNPNKNVVNVEPLNLSRNNISSCSLETRKPHQKNMLNEAYTAMLDKDIVIENTNSCTPSGSPGEGEKTFTVTIPHLEYVGYIKADQGNSGSLHGRASLRELKLLAYHSVLQALYLQGTHNWNHEFLLTNLREALSISNEEHSTALRRLTTANYD
ncbi:hypothetical protein SUGI_0929520 [Cryptomeria japonica]|uniref:uncharacterized protein LOC131072557 n=1 Tax=Cryptomeria japonica TaxID=3369 RepID=UPI002414AC9D|nr:uncharacterized protein LOC131072557 [Cryptomeria japonica]GLJ44361.1 hypothetical protein SUGI_0929520 [Cryptomeria japonica]